MKKVVFFESLFFCLLLTSVASLGANNGWENRPLMKRSSGKQASVASDESAPKKSRLKKTDIAWYKKPSAQYAAGGLFSALVGAYALFQHMQGQVSAPVAEDKVSPESTTTDNKNNSTDVDNKKNTDDALPTADNKIVLTDPQQELTKEEVAVVDRNNAADNIVRWICNIGKYVVVPVAGGSAVLAGLAYAGIFNILDHITI